MPILLIALLIWFVIDGMQWASVVVGIAVGMYVLIALSPVIGAGLLRGREERAVQNSALGSRPRLR